MNRLVRYRRALAESAKAGDRIGVHVSEHAGEHDKVYRITPD